MAKLEPSPMSDETMVDAGQVLSVADLGSCAGNGSAEMVMMRTYLMEFDITSPTVRLPTCFHREYGSRVDEFIMLRDPKNNEIEVMVEKRDRKADDKCKKVYFKHGWFGLRDFYRLDLGAWIDLTYESPSLMLMTVKNRFNEEVVYTECNPPIVARLNRQVCSGSRIIFKWTDMIRLAPSDVHSGYLMLPSIGFCRDRLPINDADLTVVDYLGFEWKCDFKFVEHNLSISCRIGGEWGMLCKARRLAEGRYLELAVAHDNNNDILYLKYVPLTDTEPELPVDHDPKRCLQADAHVFNLSDIDDNIASVRWDLYRLKTFRVEFDLDDEKARLPRCFAKELGIHVDERVILRDPNHNMIVVDVDKRQDKIYLRQGWLRLKDVYGINLGAWITLTYVRSNLLLIRIKSRIGVEIAYPMNPSLAVPRYITTKGVVCLVNFFRTTVKVLTSDDILSGYLTLPWFGFCQRLLPNRRTVISVVDWTDTVWRCDLSFIVGNDMLFCRLGGEWKILCNTLNLRKGYAVKLAVTEDRDNTEIIIRHTPLRCAHMTYVKPMFSIGAKYTYKVNHYLKSCPVLDGQL